MRVTMFVSYTCPFCYLTVQYANELLVDFPQIKLELSVCEAHPTTASRSVFSPQDGWWKDYILPVAQETGVSVEFPFMPLPYENKAIEGFAFLQDSDFDTMKYHMNIYDAVYKHCKNIEDIDVVLKAMGYLKASDIAGARFALESGQYEKSVNKMNNLAYNENHVEVVPTLVAGETRLEAKLGHTLTKEKLADFFKIVLK